MKKAPSVSDEFLAGAEAAFARALVTARREHGELILVHVLEGLMPPGGERMPPESSRSARRWRQQCARASPRLRARAERAGVPASNVLAEGWVPEQIAKLAKERQADLIVIGTHGRAGWARMMRGSVAERVIVLAPCPLLTVRGK